MSAPPPPERSPRVVLAALVGATISSVFPGFLIGAISVQVAAEFDVSEATYGWALGSFFLAATIGSVGLGRLAQRIGPRRQIATALTATALTQLLLAWRAGSFRWVVVALAIAGFVNSANQTAVNLALTREHLPRLGLSIAVKQSSMPAAALLSGLAVPGLALTVGWRWAYVLGAVLAATSAVFVHAVLAPMPPEQRRLAGDRPVSARSALLQVAASGAFLAFAAGALSAWLVASGVDAGLSEGVAGLMLSIGAASGITLRLFWGARLDSMNRSPLLVGGVTVLIGAGAYAALGIRAEWPHVAATFAAFGAGWVWPVFTNFAVVRANVTAAAAATGVSQTGVYIGVFAAPLVTGWLIDTRGYPTMWLVVAVAAVVGAVLSIRASGHF